MDGPTTNTGANKASKIAMQLSRRSEAMWEWVQDLRKAGDRRKQRLGEERIGDDKAEGERRESGASMASKED